MNTTVLFDEYLKQTGEVGYVDEVVHYLVRIRGLPTVHVGEQVLFERGDTGQVSAIREHDAEVLTFSQTPIHVGSRVVRMGVPVQIPIGEHLLGTMISPLGTHFDGVEDAPAQVSDRPVHVDPPGIAVRRRINRLLTTGVMIVDRLIPLGRGQRELVLGDRKTGKSHFVLRTHLTQARMQTVCIYVLIGKRNTEIKKIVSEIFRDPVVKESSIIVATNSNDAPGKIVLTPYAAMAIAEYFRDMGRDVLIVFDDMTTHAKFYREVSLVGRRFPGRDSYPGDIFHVHSRLLERAGCFQVGDREATITCLAVAETVQGDLTGYIQTNLMSMTDGHIYFDTDYFLKGRRPAINPFISVTRAGRQTQLPLARVMTGALIRFLNVYEKVQTFVHFGSELSSSVRQTMLRGEQLLELFSQSHIDAVSDSLQMILVAMIWADMWDKSSAEKLAQAYATNKSARDIVDTIITQATTMEELVSLYQKNVKKLIPFFL